MFEHRADGGPRMFALSQMIDSHLLSISKENEAPLVPERCEREVLLTCQLRNEPVSIGKMTMRE
jgi:hypothetical protein